jgi:DNA-binding MarR family transcriptional regulator
MPEPRAAKRERMLSILKQFRVLLRAMRTHYQSLAERSGLAGAQAWALAEIAARPHLSVGELARGLALHLSTVSNIVGRLERLGLVKRVRAGADQRVVCLEATAEGRRVLRRAPRPAAGLLQEALGQLAPARLAALHRDLAALIAAMGGGATHAGGIPIAELLVVPQPPRKRRPTSGSSSSSRPRAARATRPATRT